MRVDDQMRRFTPGQRRRTYQSGGGAGLSRRPVLCTGFVKKMLPGIGYLIQSMFLYMTPQLFPMVVREAIMQKSTYDLQTIAGKISRELSSGLAMGDSSTECCLLADC